VFLTACSASAPSSTAADLARVAGQVTLPTPEAPPPGTTLRLSLVDVSRADAAAVVLGEQMLEVGGLTPPYSYSIGYDPARIDPRYSYAVQARVESEGRLLYVNDRRQPVLTRGASAHADLLLRKVGGAP
jgi:putative lipoprotein